MSSPTPNMDIVYNSLQTIRLLAAGVERAGEDDTEEIRRLCAWFAEQAITAFGGMEVEFQASATTRCTRSNPST